MNPLSSTELARMQGAQESAMFDACRLLTPTDGATNDYGHAPRTFAAGSEIACGLNEGRTWEVTDGAETALAEARLRLPIATVIDSTHLVRVTKRHGVTLGTPIDYEVIGHPRRGPSGLVLMLRRASYEITVP